MDDVEKKVQKLLNLPNLVNWVRHNKRRLDDTVFQVREFAIDGPRHSLQPVQKLCANLAYGKIDQVEAIRLAGEFSRPIIKAAAKEVIPAFCAYLKTSNIQGVPDLEGFAAMYIIGKKPNGEPLLVPVKPTFIGIKNELLTPVFTIPWASFNLDPFQKHLLSTIVCDAILTQQDFLSSDAEIVAFPRIKNTKTRYQRGWNARQYDLLTEDDLLAQFERYSQALKIVIAELRTV